MFSFGQNKKKKRTQIGIVNSTDNFDQQIGIINFHDSDSNGSYNNDPCDSQNNSIGILNEEGAINNGIQIDTQDL